jgi:pimeloyl-ACP methyl ester carboxylesterase
MKNIRLHFLLRGFLLAMLFLGVPTAKASTIYSSFGSGDSFDSSSWFDVGWSADYKRGLASPFDIPSSGDYIFDSVSLPLTVDYGKNIEISIWEDLGSAGSSPNWTKIESLAVNPSNIKSWKLGYPVLTFTSKTKPLLKSGATYWLRVEPATKSFTSSSKYCNYSWYCSPSGNTPKFAYLPIDPGMKSLPDWKFSSESVLLAFRVSGTLTSQNFTLTNETPYWDFRTPPGPSVKLSWSAVPGALGYEVWRDGVLIYPKTGKLTDRTFTNELGLTPGGTHTFQIIATTASGRSVSNTISAIMPADPGASAVKPGGLALRADNSEWINGTPSVVLRWTDASGGNSYEIFRDGKSIAKVGDQNEYTDENNLKPGATVKYKINSKNSSGLTESNTVPVVLATAPASVVGNFTFTNKEPTLTGTTPKKPSVVLNWTTAAGVEAYDVFRNGVRIAKDLTGFTFTDSAGLAQGTTYSYYILAKGPGGETYSTDRSVTMPAEAILSLGDFTLTFSPAYWDDDPPPAGPAVVLNWTASKNADFYSVYRDGTLYKGGIRGLQFTNDIDLTPGGTHTFFVRAVNGSLTKDSKTVSIQMPSGPSTPTGATLLKHDVPITVPAGNAGATRIFKVEVTQQVERLEVTSQGGTGDIDLYIQPKALPKLDPPTYIDNSVSNGNIEQVEVQSPVAGTVYYVLVSGKQAFSGVTLTARLIPGAGKVGDPKVVPDSQFFTKAFDLVMTPTTPDSEIWYTIGANPPRPEPGKCELYDPSKPRRISGTTKIIAIASKAGMKDSSPVERSYTASPNMGMMMIVPFQTVEVGTIPAGEEKSYELVVPTDQITADSMSGVACVGFYLQQKMGIPLGQPVADISLAGRLLNRLDITANPLALFPQLNGKEFGVLDLQSIVSSGERDLGGKWVIRVHGKNWKALSGYTLTAYYTPVSVRSISGPIQQSKETWLVCHGRMDKSTTFETLATNLDRRKTDDQVLLVDWMGAQAESLLGYSNGAVVRLPGDNVSLAASRFIDTTADKLYSWMRQRSIAPDRLNWIGHSWGALMGFEFADQASSGGRISTLVALDPASGGIASGIVLGDSYSGHSRVDFRTNTRYSMSFVSPSGLVGFGDAKKAGNSTDSFLVNFGLQKNGSFDSDLAAHRGVWMVYEKILSDCYPLPASKNLSGLFQIENSFLRSSIFWTPNRYENNFAAVQNGVSALLHEGVIHATLSGDKPPKLISINYLEYFDTKNSPKSLSD